MHSTGSHGLFSDEEELSPAKQRQETEPNNESEEAKSEPDLDDFNNASIPELEARMRELERKLKDKDKSGDGAEKKRDTKRKDKETKKYTVGEDDDGGVPS